MKALAFGANRDLTKRVDREFFMLRSAFAALAVLCLGAGLSPGVAPADAQGGQTEAAPKTTRSAWFKHQPWNSTLPEVKKTGSGLEYVVITAGPGNGATAPAGRRSIHRSGVARRMCSASASWCLASPKRCS
jgi:hypothetical protein